MASKTQDMRYRQSLMKYAQKFGVALASRKYSKSQSHILLLADAVDGTLETLAYCSRRPHCYPNTHSEAELKLIRICVEEIPIWVS